MRPSDVLDLATKLYYLMEFSYFAFQNLVILATFGPKWPIFAYFWTFWSDGQWPNRTYKFSLVSVSFFFRDLIFLEIRASEFSDFLHQL